MSPSTFRWVVAAVLAAMMVLLNLPRGFSDDLSHVGKGKMAIVLLRDKNVTQGFDLMDALNSIRSANFGQGGISSG